MHTILGIVGLLTIVVVAVRVGRALRGVNPRESRRRSLSSGRNADHHLSAPTRRPTHGDDVGGWLVGHQVARGHHGFPGDPLPDGHLGRPTDLAFWGGVFDDEDEAD